MCGVIRAPAYGKVYLIVRHFMDVRSSPRWLRVFTDVWILCLGAAIAVTYAS
jgi:hypothetical protein